ncbi:MAG: hypothetical protein E7039_11690 [Lentisphaerae bacterium]|nr:hypothetical protein [Lentisphaerota bacterium]
MKKEIFGAALSGLLLAGCCCNTCLDFKEVDTADYPVYAVKNNEKIVIDGKLDEKVWQQCLPANLINIPFFRGYGKALANVNKDKFQGAEIYLAYDKDYLYVAGRLADEDIIQYDKNHQAQSYATGDTFELFLKPKNKPYYWEIYVTPQNSRSSFFYLSPGAGTSYSRNIVHFIKGMRSAVQLNGTLNDTDDRDTGWTFELAIPVKDLAEKGVPFDGKVPWQALPARYNYDVNFRYVQLSTYPPTPVAGNHLVEYYGDIQFK